MEEYAWTTSWGASTRLIGGLIMTHGDDDGLVLPPKIASSHLVLLPIYRKPDEKSAVMVYTEKLANRLRMIRYHDRPIEVEIDDREIGGTRGWDWIKKGIPLRVEIGPRDIAANSVFVGRRDLPSKMKESILTDRFVDGISELLDKIQNNIFQKALRFREKHTVAINDAGAFNDFFTPKNSEKPEIHGGFALAAWCGSAGCENRLKTDLRVTIRCIPFDNNLVGHNLATDTCIHCGAPADQQVVFAKAY
jgi:prolyl-tRNA synthetase